MVAPSIVSESSTTSSTHAKKLIATKPAAKIIIDNHFSTKAYTSGSVISGTVVVEPEYDVAFDTIQVLLMGVSKTETDSTAGPLLRQHLFLKLQMPISDDQFPVPRAFERGITYSFPFNFVIPNYLTINACNHPAQGDHIRDAHVLLPPSLGHWPRDDMSPKMAKVEYSIRSRILRDSTHPGGKLIKLCEAIHPIFVLPTSYEEPPLSIRKEDRAYRTNRIKSIRKGLFSSKLGELSITASQPAPVVLRPDGRACSATTANLSLIFDPVSADAVPPKVTAVSSKIVAHTYYSNDGFSKFPNIGHWSCEFGQHRRGEYYTSVQLAPPAATPTAKWKQQLKAQARRDSGYGTETYSESESERPRSSSSPILHSANLSIPVSLPTNKKTFVPTFHSCISSRVYVLHLSVNAASGTSNTILSVAVPLQVVVEATDGHQKATFGLPTFQDVIEQEEAEAAADEALMPRILRVPELEFSPLPGYDELDRHQPVATF